MLKAFKKECWKCRDPPLDIVKREVKLPQMFSTLIVATVKFAFGKSDSVIHLWKAYLSPFSHGMCLIRLCLPKWVQ